MTPLSNAYWVQSDRLLAGEHPFGRDPVDAHNRLAALRAAGIDFFIDLTEPFEMPSYRRLLPRRAAYVRLSIPDHQVPREVAHMREIQSRIHEALAADRHVYVHCRAGIGRTALAIGCYLVEQGLDGAAALEELNRVWQRSNAATVWPRIPETAEQTQYIRNWVACGKHTR
jgi:hypothetical protein